MNKAPHRLPYLWDMLKVTSYQVADSIDTKGVKSAFKAYLHHGNSQELFYENGSNRYVSVFKYGAVSFYNHDEIAISSFLQFLAPFCRNLFTEALNDELIVETGASESKVSYNKIDIISADREVIRMIMQNVAESVTLDYYSQQTTLLMEETNFHTQKLEKKGRMAISGTNLKKYIGKTLLLKNSISANLYIFDSLPETWENEQLDKLNNELRKNFDLQDRSRDVSEGLGIVKENLELFKDLLQYRNSVVLEWVIIILIAIEVVNFLVEKLL